MIEIRREYDINHEIEKKKEIAQLIVDASLR